MRMNRGGHGFRGGMRGRPRHFVPEHMRHRPYPTKFHVTHQVFDEAQADMFFTRASPQPEDSLLNQALLQRNQELTPGPAEQVAVQNLVVKVEHVIEALILCSEDLDVAVEEVRMVGSYKKGTMLAGHPVADMVIVLKGLPTDPVIAQLASKVDLKLKESEKKSAFAVKTNEGGFNVTSTGSAGIRCLVTTLPRHLLQADPEKHVDVKLLEGAIATVRHARWFEENAFHTTIRVLVRLLKDMKQRFPGLAPLTPWLVDLLAHRATMENSTREPLPLNDAFRRAMRLLSSGIFLPGSVGIVDPCESGNLRAHVVLGLDEQDSICQTSQTLLRCLSAGGCNALLGVAGKPGTTSRVIDQDVTTWNGVVVVPGETAYKPEKQPEPCEEAEAETQPTDTAPLP